MSDVTIVGRLGKFGSGMVQKKADAIGEEFVAQLRAGLTTKPDPDSQPEAPDTTLAASESPPKARLAWVMWGVAALVVGYLIVRLLAPS